MMLIAHRAGNTIDVARAALAAGADLVEADVWLHRGTLEVRHSKTLGPVPLRWDRWSLESSHRHCLTLAELLDALGPDADLLFDLKGSAPAIAERMVETMRRHRPGRPIVVSSQNWALLERLRQFDGARLIHSIGYPWQLRSAWQRLRPEQHDAVSVQYRLLDAEVVARLKERVTTVITWPVNDLARLAQVQSWGVDGVTSDSLDVIRAAAAGRPAANR